MGSEPHRQLVSLPDFICRDVGQRHLGRRDQPFVISTEQILTEFRELTGAGHRRAVHKERRQGFLIAEFACMRVEHECRQRPLKPRQLSAKNDEPRARKFRRCGKIHLPQPLANRDMIPWGKVKGRNVPPASKQCVVILVRAVRHLGVENVRKLEQHRLQAGCEGTFLLLEAGHLRLDFIDFGDQVVGILALPLAHADFLGSDIAAGLHVLNLALQGTPLCVGLKDGARLGFQPATRHGGVECVGVFTDKADVVHLSASS